MTTMAFKKFDNLTTDELAIIEGGRAQLMMFQGDSSGGSYGGRIVNALYYYMRYHYGV